MTPVLSTVTLALFPCTDWRLPALSPAPTADQLECGEAAGGLPEAAHKHRDGGGGAAGRLPGSRRAAAVAGRAAAGGGQGERAAAGKRGAQQPRWRACRSAGTARHAAEGPLRAAFLRQQRRRHARRGARAAVHHAAGRVPRLVRLCEAAAARHARGGGASQSIQASSSPRLPLFPALCLQHLVPSVPASSPPLLPHPLLLPSLFCTDAAVLCGMRRTRICVKRRR